MRFVDGGFAYNNPVQRVMVEARDLWGSERPALLVSIGTGETLGRSLAGNVTKLARAMSRLVTETERTANDFYESHRDMAKRRNNEMYVRFNVPGLAEIGLQEYKQVEAITAHTTAHVLKGPVGEELSDVAERIMEIQAIGDLDSIHHKVSELTQQDQACMQALFDAAGNYEDHRMQLEKPVDGTCSWILEHRKYLDFIQCKGAALLWITGNPGCGKSILSRFLADQLESAGKAKEPVTSAPIVCSFFFREGHDQRTNHQSAVAALLHQLFNARPALAQFSREEYGAKGIAFARSPEAVWRIICNACSQIPHREIICIVDALDECEETSRERFIKMMQNTFAGPDATSSVGCFKMLVTSRPRSDIERSWGPNTTIRLRGEDETQYLNHDVQMVIQDRVQKLAKIDQLSVETCDLVKGMLEHNADGTFLWVALVLDTITTSPSRKLGAVKRLLETIPKKLDRLYDHPFWGIDHDEDKERSRRLLRTLLAATRPFSLDEMNIVLSLESTMKTLKDVETEPDINYTVKRLGGFFVRVINSQVSLVHKTAREYLLKSHGIIPGNSWKQSICILESNVELAKRCIQYLQLEDWGYFITAWKPPGDSLATTKKGCVEKEATRKRSNRVLLQVLPEHQANFYEYAAMNWSRHIEGGGESSEWSLQLCTQIDAFCDKSRKSFTSWWNYYDDSDKSTYRESMCRNINQESNHLHHAASNGDLNVFKALLRANSISITDQNYNGWDVLVAAAAADNERIVKWILLNFSSEPLQREQALIKAAGTGNKHLVEMILKNSGEVDGQSLEAPLHQATVLDAPAVVELLLAKGAEPCDEIALSLAIEFSHTSASLFLEHCRSGTHDPGKWAKILLHALKAILNGDTEPHTTIIQKWYDRTTKKLVGMKNRSDSLISLVLSQGMKLPGHYCLSCRLFDAVQKRDISAIASSLADGARDELGIALILSSGYPETLRELLRKIDYTSEHIWAAFEHLDSDMASFCRRLLIASLRFRPSAARRPKLSRTRLWQEADECLDLFLPHLTDLKTSFSKNLIKTLLQCGHIIKSQGVGFLKTELAMVLQGATHEVTESCFTLACICGAEKMTSELTNVNLKDKHGMTRLLAASLATHSTGEPEGDLPYQMGHGASLDIISWYVPENGSNVKAMTTLCKNVSTEDKNQGWEALTSANAACRLTQYISADTIKRSWEFIWTLLGKETFAESPASLCHRDWYWNSTCMWLDLPDGPIPSRRLPGRRKVKSVWKPFTIGLINFKACFGHSSRVTLRDGHGILPSYAFFDDIPRPLILSTPYAPRLNLGGRTALHHAAQHDDRRLIVELIQGGHSAAAVNAEKETPMHSFAASRPDFSQEEEFPNDMIIDAMIRSGARLTDIDGEFCTPLHRSILSNSPKKATDFIRAGSPVDTESIQGHTPLRDACAFWLHEGWLRLIRQLVEEGARPLSTDDKGLTPLHCLIGRAARWDTGGTSVDILRILVDRAVETGVSLSDKYGDGLTLLEFSKGKRRDTTPGSFHPKILDAMIRVLEKALLWGRARLKPTEIPALHELQIDSYAKSEGSLPDEDFWLEDDTYLDEADMEEGNDDE